MRKLEAGKVLVLGDVHGNFGQLKELLDQTRPDVVLQCGDFGVWPPGGIDLIKDWFCDLECELFFCPGNHEWWDELDKFPGGLIHRLTDKVHYCAFGSTLHLNGETILFVGGADSIDKRLRTEKVSWWKQEIILESDMDNLPACDVQVVVSHTVPTCIQETHNDINIYGYRDPSTKQLQRIMNKYTPHTWYFGHFHRVLQGSVNNCKYFGLNTLNSPGGARWHTREG